MSTKQLYTLTTEDYQTGEIISKQWLTKKAASKDHFVKLYLDDLKLLKKLTNADHRVLHNLSILLEYNTNQFFLNKERRQEMADLCSLSINTLNQSISRLCKKNLLIKVSSFTYQMNPKIFFNGDELQRAKVMELTIQYVICPDC